MTGRGGPADPASAGRDPGPSPGPTSLPPAWLERLEALVRAAECPLVVIEDAPGWGGERLLTQWASRPWALAVAESDLERRDRFRSALRTARRKRPEEHPVWVLARSSRPTEHAALGGELLPGERLVLLSAHGTPAPEDALVIGRERLGLEEGEAADWFRSDDGGARLVARSRGWMFAVEGAARGEGGWHALPAGGAREDGVEAADGGVAVHLDLLGTPRIRAVSDGGEQEIEWPYSGVLEVLASLALAGSAGRPRDELAGAVWPDLDPEPARRQIYPAVSHLRSLFRGLGLEGPAVVAHKGVYRLAPTWPWVLDIDRLRHVMEATEDVAADLLEAIAEHPRPVVAGEDRGALESAAARLQDGWRCYRGELLRGVEKAWLAHPREEFRRIYLTLLERLAAVLGRLGRVEEVEEVLRTLLVRDPLQEDAHVALMRLYSRRGRVDLVRRQYERMSSVLLDEMGMLPMDRTLREVERLLA